MYRTFVMAALAASVAGLAAPAKADYQTATFAGPSAGSYSFGTTDTTDPVGTMIGAAFVVTSGTFHMSYVGANFDGNDNSLPGLGVQEVFVAIIPLANGSALPSVTPASLTSIALGSVAFAAPTTPGDLKIPLHLDLQAGAYAAIFGGAGFFGSDAAGAEGLQDSNTTIGTPNIFSNFDGTTWSAYTFDTGIRIFEVPEPASMAIISLGLLGLAAVRRRTV